MILNKHDYEQLLSFFGYGNFPQADLVFWGNEEGTGQFPLEANLRARCVDFGKDEKGNLIYAINKANRLDGYFEISSRESDQKIISYLDEGFKLKNKNSKFLNMIARLSLALETKDENYDQWFEFYKDNKAIKNRVVGFERHEILEPREGIQSALIDWKPLPKKDEETWYDYEYQHIDKNKYIHAFEFSSKEIKADQFSNYTADAKKRSAILENVFSTYTFPLLIGFGDVGIKKNLLEEIFSQTDFEDIYSESLGKPLGIHGKIIAGHQEKTVLLLPFPDPRLRVFCETKGDNKLMKYYKEVFKNYILPLF